MESAPPLTIARRNGLGRRAKMLTHVVESHTAGSARDAGPCFQPVGKSIHRHDPRLPSSPEPIALPISLFGFLFPLVFIAVFGLLRQ